MAVDRVEVTFLLHEYDNGQPFLALAFSRDGKPVVDGGKLFTMDLSPGTSRLEADTIVHLLRRKVTHLLMASPEAPVGLSAPQASSEPSHP